MQDVFIRPANTYKRKLNYRTHYNKQMAFYLSRMTGRKFDDCYEYVVRKAEEKFVDPKVIYYERHENKDKHKAQSTLTEYINGTLAKEEILVPTFTTYVSQKTFLSPFSGFMIRNKKRRSISKKKGFAAKMKGDMIYAIFYDKEQNNYKTFNNAGSGCYGSKGSILFNPTSHSALTSCVRTETSIANASNEKMIEGNRHYRNIDIILNNILSICTNYDVAKTHAVIQKYNLNIPTVQDVIDCINRSFELYFYDKKGMSEKIIPFVCKLSDLDRFAFCFIGDLYHFKKLNDRFSRNFLRSLSIVHRHTQVVDNPIETMNKTIDEAICNHVNQLFSAYIKGVPKDEFSKVLPADVQQDMYNTALTFNNILSEHSDLIEVLFLTENLPASTAYIYDMVRRCVVGSDTDATMFVVDGPVEWMFGHTDITEETMSFASTIMFLSTKTMAHQLAVFSANLGIVEEKIFDIAMKPEYTFPVYFQSPVAKHYFTFATVQEGSHLAKYKFEYKGVHLKNSAHPSIITKETERVMSNLMLNLYKNKKPVLGKELMEVIALEKEIKRSLLAGENTYYKSTDIKPAKGYKLGPDKSPYRFHDMWREVFEPKYGSIEEPDYKAIKVPLNVKNTLVMKKWLDGIEDRALALRLGNYLLKNGKKKLLTIQLNTSYVTTNGIPKEIQEVLDYKRVILDLTISRRMVLSSLAYYPKEGMTLTEMYEGSI